MSSKYKENNIRIAIDLELEQPYTNKQTPDSLLEYEKIIQIGWVVFNQETSEILDEQSRFVNIHNPLSTFIKELTGISDEDIVNGGTVTQAFLDLSESRKTYQAGRILVEWGGGDFRSLSSEVIGEIGEEAWKSTNAFGRSQINAKHLYRIYREANGLNSSAGLAKSLKNMGLAWEGGQKHDAMADARNTARIYSKLWSLYKGIKV